MRQPHLPHGQSFLLRAQHGRVGRRDKNHQELSKTEPGLSGDIQYEHHFAQNLRESLVGHGCFLSPSARDVLPQSRLGLPIGLQLYSVERCSTRILEGTLREIAAARLQRGRSGRILWPPGCWNSSRRWTRPIPALRQHPPQPCSNSEQHLDEFASMATIVGVALHHQSLRDEEKNPRPKERSEDNQRLALDGRGSSNPHRYEEEVKAQGMTFGYHNRAQKFRIRERSHLLRRVITVSPIPSSCASRWTGGWVVTAGHNPVDYQNRSPARFPLLHIEETVKGENGKLHSTVKRHGVIDYRPDLRAATEPSTTLSSRKSSTWTCFWLCISPCRIHAQARRLTRTRLSLLGKETDLPSRFIHCFANRLKVGVDL